MEIEIYFSYLSKKNCKFSSKVTFLHTITVIFCFEHLKYSLSMLISFLKSWDYALCTSPLSHYVSLGTISYIIQTLTTLFKKLDPPLCMINPLFLKYSPWERHVFMFQGVQRSLQYIYKNLGSLSWSTCSTKILQHYQTSSPFASGRSCMSNRL